MDGRIEIVEGSLRDLLAMLMANQFAAYRSNWWLRLMSLGPKLLKRWHQMNRLAAARTNVAHHYDLSAELYRLFLDTDQQYSCAYFAHAGMDIEAAQTAKKQHLAAKLLLKPRQKVLDIGSGWGGLGLYLAKANRVDVTGLTLSTEQHKISNARATDAGLGNQARFLLQDYRTLDERFDRIVSVGMFEHVGVNNYRAYFQQVNALLKPDGVGVIHSIGRLSGPAHTSRFIQKYIFPGGYIPALSEVIPAIERSGLYITDVEILRLHYAETLARWHSRFQANRERIKAIYDERFCRMWEFYLLASEMFFRVQDGMVFQIQVAKSMDSVPLTRDYMYEVEHQLMAAEKTAA